MAFFIQDIRNTPVTAGKKYLLDTNVWLFLLDAGPRPKPFVRHYLNFVQMLTNVSLNPKPKIIVSSLILAETVNRHLRDVSYKKYCAKYGINANDKKNYKDSYRCSSAFLNDYKNLVEDLLVYKDVVLQVPDQFGASITLDVLLNNPISKLDFNDQYYYLLAKKHGYSIVTHDCDFYVEDVEVITSNTQLLNQGK